MPILTADRGDAGRRLDLVLRRRLTDVPGASRTRVQHWIANGRVTVNGRIVRRAAARLGYGDVVAIGIEPPRARQLPAPEAAELVVLYEDDHMIVIDKPAGVVVHPTYKHPSGTLMNALLWRARAWPAGQRPTLVGRLDRLTSGLVVAAKTTAAHAALQRAMRHAAKEYLAVVYGRVPARPGTIQLPLARDARDRRRVVVAEAGGAASVTHLERLSRVAAAPVGVALVRCRIATGRMHQIRVHLAARGWPIVGDRVYGEPLAARLEDAALAAALDAFPRQALHAWRLALDTPFDARRRLQIEAPLPADFAGLLAAAGLSLCRS